MNPDADYNLSELERRLANLIRLGTVEQADYQAAKVRVRAGDLLTDWLPWLTARAGADRTWWAPEVGEQVLMLSPDDDPAGAIVVVALYQAAHPPLAKRETVAITEYADGTRISYDREASHLHMDAVGQVTITAAGPVTVQAQGDLTLEGQQIRLN